MTEKEKLYNDIRKALIEKDGENFLRLTNKDQNNIVLAILRAHGLKLEDILEIAI